MDSKILEEVGLTKGEIKVYLTLLELGSSSAGFILKKAQIQNSVFHFNINSLIEKGIVAYIRKGGARLYYATNPDSLLDYLDNKKKELKKIIPELKQRQSSIKEKEYAEIFESKKGVITALNLLIDEVKPQDEFLFFSADESERDKEIQDFYTLYDVKRKDKKLVVKGIVPKKLKALFEKRKHLNVKYVDFPIPENTGICGDKMVIISWSESPRAILISSKKIVSKQKIFFKEIWERIKE